MLPSAPARPCVGRDVKPCLRPEQQPIPAGHRYRDAQSPGRGTPQPILELSIASALPIGVHHVDRAHASTLPEAADPLEWNQTNDQPSLKHPPYRNRRRSPALHCSDGSSADSRLAGSGPLRVRHPEATLQWDYDTDVSCTPKLRLLGGAAPRESPARSSVPRSRPSSLLRILLDRMHS